MTTEHIPIRTSAPGAVQTRSQLNAVAASVTAVGTATRGVFSTFVGGGLLAGLFGVTLLSVASSSGEASNAQIRLQDTLEDFLGPAYRAIDAIIQWYRELTVLEQVLSGLGVALLLFLRGPIANLLLRLVTLLAGITGLTTTVKLFIAAFAGAIGTIATIVAIVGLAAIAFYFLYTRFEQFRRGVDSEVIGGINELIVGFNQGIDVLNLFIRGIDYVIDKLQELNEWLTFTLPRLEVDLPDIPGLSTDLRINVGGQAFSPLGEALNLPERRLGPTPQIPHIPTIQPLADRIPEQFLRQEGQSLFSLTEFERSILDHVDFGLLGNDDRGIGGTTAPLPQYQPLSQDTINNFNFSTLVSPEQFRDGLADPNTRARANGGP